jgi:hypothetical protein
MKDTPFFKQADLLVQVLPFVHAEACFALKGGTAINLFVRDFPRLSVDLDLVYLPIEKRPATLRNIDAALMRLAMKIRRALPGVQVWEKKHPVGKSVIKLAIRDPSGAEIKVEPNLVLRGSLHQATDRTMTARAVESFDRVHHEPAGCRVEPASTSYGFSAACRRSSSCTIG